MAMQRRQEDDGMITKVVSINRVSKTVKGGRVMKFAALIVVGDGKGNIGYGHKGQKARSGVKKAGFEGGQMPLQRRLPKHGFKNFPFKVTYDVINLDRLQEAFEGKSEITLDDIYARGLARLGAPVKVLSRGEVKSAIKVEAHKFSQAAAEKIRNAGGEATELEAAQAAE